MTTDMLYLSRFQAEARHCSRLVLQALAQRRLRAPAAFYLTERHNLVWLAVILNLRQLEGKLEAFVSQDTLHHISTVLRGRCVFLSNSNGLRYMVLLTPAPKLPESIDFPVKVERNAMPLGVGLMGPVQLLPPRNMLICGEPGSGKSTLLASALHAARQHRWDAYFADPDGHTFNPDLLNSMAVQPVAQSPNELLVLLEQIKAELLRRQALFRAAAQNGLPPADLETYNQVAVQPLPRMLLLMDEANSYFDNKATLEKLTDLARRGRKWGLTVSLAGHNWRAADVPRALSTMFPVRVSFRVSDNTTAAVVLDDRQWGKEAQKLCQPGRGILLMDGNFSIFQAYRLTAEQAVSAQPVEMNPLSDVERALVVCAWEQLQGRFIVNQLAQALAEQGVSHHQVQKIAEQFEHRSWLTKPRHATDARRITPELARLAGVSRTGVQAVQAHTRAIMPIQGPVQA